MEKTGCYLQHKIGLIRLQSQIQLYLGLVFISSLLLCWIIFFYLSEFWSFLKKYQAFERKSREQESGKTLFPSEVDPKLKYDKMLCRSFSLLPDDPKDLLNRYLEFGFLVIYFFSTTPFRTVRAILVLISAPTGIHDWGLVTRWVQLLIASYFYLHQKIRIRCGQSWVI